MEFIPAKTILSAKNKYARRWFGTDYNINLYKGCCHGCIYCDSRSSCYGIENFDTVRAKQNALSILEKQLASKRETGVVGMGAMSDPYNAFEKETELTRGALKLLEKYGFGAAIATKSDLILRDIDLLKKIQKKNNVIVKISLTTANDSLAKQIEPYASPVTQRLQAIEELNRNGIFSGILMHPVLPFLTDSDENITHLIQSAAQHSAKFIHTYLGMTLRENQRVYYYNKLDALFPGLSQKYMSLYSDRYSCPIPLASLKKRLFEQTCKKYGILYSMADIIEAYKKDRNQNKQLSLF